MGSTASDFHSKYELENKTLGQGKFGQVKKATKIDDTLNQKYAVKIINKKDLAQKENGWKYLKQQISALKQFNSPFIIKYFDSSEDEQSIFIVLELCDLNLYQYQQKRTNKVFGLNEAKKILRDVIKGLDYIHNQKGYIHRDIKNSNILMKTNQEGEKIFKLADFGFSKNIVKCTGSYLGTLAYQAPQNFTKNYGKQIDIWALGVTFYYMLNGDVPFKQPKSIGLLEEQKKHYQAYLKKQARDFSYKNFVEEKTTRKITDNCTKQIENLFKKMFNPEPKERITIKQIMEHPVFAEYFR